MNDVEKAYQLLKENKFTNVCVHNNTIYSSNIHGIKPIFDFMQKGYDLHGFSTADTIVGRAAALVFVYAGIVSVHAVVMSGPATIVFKDYGINYTYDILTENIINREGSGICPMESLVEEINNPEQAFMIINNKLIHI